LLPAVQAAREAGRRAACQNHLHQLGIALHNYHDSRGSFPAAYSATVDNWFYPHWSWSTYVLPFMEQSGVYKELGVDTQSFGGGALLAPATAVTQRILPDFVCPSDTGPALNDRKNNHAKSNYRGVSGTMSQLTSTYQNAMLANGVIYMNSNTSMSAITDGTSHTLLVGECTLDDSGPGRIASIWAGMHGSDAIYSSGEDILISDAMWWVNSDSSWCINGQGLQAFSSNHPDGAQFCFADGAVHFLVNEIDGTTLECLAARNDGQTVTDF